KNNVPLYLEEELVGGVYVEISTSIRASNCHDHEFGVLPNHLSPYWRLKKMAVLFNPAFQIKGSKRLCHVTSRKNGFTSPWLHSPRQAPDKPPTRSEAHTSELQSR